MAIFTNQATLSYNNTTTTSNIVTGEIVEVLSASKNALAPDYSFDETVTYAISITNTGTTAFSNLTVTDKGVTFALKNTGDRAGDEVVQLYVSLPGGKVIRPARELKGFTRVHLEAGEEKFVPVYFITGNPA